ncbi:MAG: hypothetical protein GF401_03870 [Chitinivibrionales bacterium]|nr:hypothetical protein [Chitinivibrionales bacterium]
MRTGNIESGFSKSEFVHERAMERNSWTSKGDMKQIVKETAQTFGTDAVFRHEARNYRDLVAESGNQILKRGVSKVLNINVDHTGGIKDTLETGMVQSNDILDVWKNGFSSDQRQYAVKEYSHSAGDKASERNKSMTTRMPTDDLDIRA